VTTGSGAARVRSAARSHSQARRPSRAAGTCRRSGVQPQRRRITVPRARAR
jgi:hypothetical protein